MSKKCSACGADARDEAKFCRECGTKLTEIKIVYCSECGSKCQSIDRFCDMCGFDLIEDMQKKDDSDKEFDSSCLSSDLMKMIFDFKKLKSISDSAEEDEETKDTSDEAEYEKESENEVSFVSSSTDRIEMNEREFGGYCDAMVLEQSGKICLNELLDCKINVSHFVNEISIPVGVSDGEVYYFATSTTTYLSKHRTGPHAIAIGPSGTGKSNLLKVLMVSGAFCYSPDELQFNIVDCKSRGGYSEHANYWSVGGEKNIPHARNLYTNVTKDNIFDVLDNIKQTVNERKKLLHSVGVMDFFDYNSRKDVQSKVKSGELPSMPHSYFIFEELNRLLGCGNYRDRERIEREMLEIMSTSRSLGISLIFVDQEYDPYDSLGMYVDSCVCLDSYSSYNIRQTLGVSDPDEMFDIYEKIHDHRGKAAFSRVDKRNIVSVAYLGEYGSGLEEKLIESIREKYTDSRYYEKQRIIEGKEDSDSYW